MIIGGDLANVMAIRNWKDEPFRATWRRTRRTRGTAARA